jgi:hypothetical protein
MRIGIGGTSAHVAIGSPVATFLPAEERYDTVNPSITCVPNPAAEKLAIIGMMHFLESLGFHRVGELVREVLTGIAAAAPDRATYIYPSLHHSA